MTDVSQRTEWLTAAAAAALAEEVVRRCRILATVTDVPGETTRTFLSEGMRRANAQVAQWMRDAGMHVYSDAAGNLHGVFQGTSRDAPPLLLASHLDTVPNAGAFDGVLGVVFALALTAHCGCVLPFPLQVVAFSEEEGVRFGMPFLGSRALVGQLDQAMLAQTDRGGTSVGEAIAAYGLCCDDLPSARLTQALGYLECHIEQGPLLDHAGLPLGIVESIAGQSHAELRFHGVANHAGTTPMHLRHDALTAAAAWIVEVECRAQATPGVVATIGNLQVYPGARNVIPGEVRCTLDVRSESNTVRDAMTQQMLTLAWEIGSRRGVHVSVDTPLQQATVPLNDHFTSLLEEAVRAEGFPVYRMSSGAGHDAMVIAPHMPTAMLFLRTPDGLSHHPDERVVTGDVAAALQVGVRFLHLLAMRRESL